MSSSDSESSSETEIVLTKKQLKEKNDLNTEEEKTKKITHIVENIIDGEYRFISNDFIFGIKPVNPNEDEAPEFQTTSDVLYIEKSFYDKNGVDPNSPLSKLINSGLIVKEENKTTTISIKKPTSKKTEKKKIL